MNLKHPAFTTIRTAQTLSEAETLLAWLRRAGLHPVDLAPAAPLPLAGETSFPIQVPNEEVDVAEELLETHQIGT